MLMRPKLSFVANLDEQEFNVNDLEGEKGHISSQYNTLK